jgi:hypothetical protein
MKNTVKFQLNHFFKNTLSSVFNQFKHFLALSLLITFSFNAFSVDDSQQFNKEASPALKKFTPRFFVLYHNLPLMQVLLSTPNPKIKTKKTHKSQLG